MHLLFQPVSVTSLRTDEWSPDHDKIAYDPLQGPAYHLSKTKDFVSGQRIKRLEKMFGTVPVGLSLHCDAWRDINLSYENATEDDPCAAARALSIRVAIDMLVSVCQGRDLARVPPTRGQLTDQSVSWLHSVFVRPCLAPPGSDARGWLVAGAGSMRTRRCDAAASRRGPCTRATASRLALRARTV